jgi:proline iminopeptidase
MTPDEFTNKEFYLDVGDGHELYVQDWGNTYAKTPFIHLHGGPGAACNYGHKLTFDPQLHRVIFFDQRGAGNSRPFGSIHANTTQHLIDDIEKIRQHLSIDEFYLFGRSWGSCLSLMYAIKHPENVKSIFTGGVYLGTTEENQTESRSAKMFFPEAWQKLTKQIPSAKQPRALEYCLENVLKSNDEEAKQYAYIYSTAVLSLMRLDDRPKTVNYDSFEWQGIKVEAHYKLNNCFVPNNYIWKNVDKLTMPIYIVQGRYDVVCLPEVAHKLHQKLADSQLYWTQAGHSSSDRENHLIMSALLRAEAAN